MNLLESIQEPYANDSLRSLTQWWFYDESDLKRCWATGLRDRNHTPAQRTVRLTRVHSEQERLRDGLLTEVSSLAGALSDTLGCLVGPERRDA